MSTDSVVQKVLLHTHLVGELQRLETPERMEQVKKMVALYQCYFPNGSVLECALDFMEAGILDRDEALEISEVSKDSFSRELVRRRKARKAQR